MPYNVLFLCTGNSARSVMGEALLNYWGQGRFHAYSAGSHPRGQVHPLTLATLERSHLPTGGLRSKSWDEFSRPGAPKLDFVFTVCSNAVQEQCPYWPGQPMTAHWGIDDPAAVEGTLEEQERAFRRALRELDARIKLFINLPLEKLDGMSLQQRLRAIGGTTCEPKGPAATSQQRSRSSRDGALRGERSPCTRALDPASCSARRFSDASQGFTAKLPESPFLTPRTWLRPAAALSAQG